MDITHGSLINLMYVSECVEVLNFLPGIKFFDLWRCEECISILYQIGPHIYSL
jgi:hypothetical protein